MSRTSLQRALAKERQINRAAKRAGRPGVALSPIGIEREYKIELNRIVNRVSGLIKGNLLPYLKHILEQNKRLRPDSAGSDVNTIMGLIRAQTASNIVNPDSARRMAGEVAGRVSTHGKRQMDAMFMRSLGVKPKLFEPYLRQEMENFAFLNSNLITSLPDQMLSRVETTVLSSVQSGETVGNITKELMKQVEITKKRAAVIARDQVLSFHADLNRLRQEEVGVEEYIWRTSGDGSVRPEHAELDGQKFKWSDPPPSGPNGEPMHPGEPIQCRCASEPVLSFSSKLKLED
jgi:SPP1 gp7 family putative phage head morphogenesis protein